MKFSAGGPAPAPAPAMAMPSGMTHLEQRAWQQKHDLELRAQAARVKMEEQNRKRAEAEMKKAKYQEWLAQNDNATDAESGVVTTDQGIHRTTAMKPTAWDDAPDPPVGRNSMAPSYWLPNKLTPDFATYGARQSVRVDVKDGVIQKSIGFDKGGTFHPVRHFHAGSAYERYRRGMPPGYMGHIPNDATPVTGGKIGVIEKKHPILYSTVRPATGSQVLDIMDDVHDQSVSQHSSHQSRTRLVCYFMLCPLLVELTSRFLLPLCAFAVDRREWLLSAAQPCAVAGV